MGEWIKKIWKYLSMGEWIKKYLSMGEWIKKNMEISINEWISINGILFGLKKGEGDKRKNHSQKDNYSMILSIWEI